MGRTLQMLTEKPSVPYSTLAGLLVMGNRFISQARVHLSRVCYCVPGFISLLPVLYRDWLQKKMLKQQ
jgi:hypothetical protein